MNDSTQTEFDLEPLENIEGETKSEAFERLARARYTKLVKRIRLLGNLGNRNNYEYTDEQIAMLFGHIRVELDDAEARFRSVDDDEIVDPFET